MLRVVASALGLATKSKRALRVIWKSNRYQKCPLARLFKPAPVEIRKPPDYCGLRYLQGWDEDLVRAVDVFSRHAAIFVSTCFPLVALRPGVQSYKLSRPLEPEVLQATLPLSPWLQSLRPHPTILKRVQAYGVQGRLGVHVRHGDNSWAQKHAPLHLFFTHMDRWSGPGFFLATDSPRVVEIMRNRYKDVVTQAKRPVKHPRGPVAIEDALVDILLLSKTARVIGSCHSSFSQVAAAWGRVPLDVIHDYGGR